MPRLKRRTDIEDSLDILAKPALRRHKRFSEAREWILNYREQNPNATAKQVVAAAEKAGANGELVAALVKLIVALTPLLIAILDAIS